MARFKLVNGVRLPLTAAEETARDAYEAEALTHRLPNLKAHKRERLHAQAVDSVIKRYIRLGTDAALKSEYNRIRAEINSATSVSSLRSVSVVLPK